MLVMLNYLEFSENVTAFMPLHFYSCFPLFLECSIALSQLSITSSVTSCLTCSAPVLSPFLGEWTLCAPSHIHTCFTASVTHCCTCLHMYLSSFSKLFSLQTPFTIFWELIYILLKFSSFFRNIVIAFQLACPPPCSPALWFHSPCHLQSTISSVNDGWCFKGLMGTAWNWLQGTINMGLIYFLYQDCLDPSARGCEKLGEESGADSRNLHGLDVQGCVTGASLGSWLRVVMESKDTVQWPQVVAEFFVWSWERRAVWEIQRVTGISLFKIYSLRIWNFKIL